MPMPEDSMSTPNRPLPPKKDVATALLEGPSLFIHLDPRKAEVVVPPYFKKQPQLVLQVGLNMPVPIPDLVVDDHGVSCTLSFNRSPYWCRIPWASVYALVGEDGKGMIWPSEVPSEVAAQMEGRSLDAGDRGASPGSPRVARSASKKRRQPSRSTGRASSALSEAGARARPGAPSTSDQPGDRSVPEPQGSPPSASSPDAAPLVASAEDPAKKGKRELPPYLRVVK